MPPRKKKSLPVVLCPKTPRKQKGESALVNADTKQKHRKKIGQDKPINMSARKKKSLPVVLCPKTHGKRKSESALVNSDTKQKRRKKTEQDKPNNMPARKEKILPVVLCPKTLGKRKSESALVNSDTKQKRSKKTEQDKPNVDMYCWMCHTIGKDKKCKCMRVYHHSCLIEASKQVWNKKKCPECQLKSVDGTELSRPFPVNCNILLASATSCVIEKYKKMKKIFLSWPKNLGQHQIVKRMDLNILLAKTKMESYKTTVEFYSDVKYIFHNCCIVYGVNSKEAKDVIELMKDLKDELVDIEACPDCYYNLYCKTPEDSDESDKVNSDNFVRLCEPCHDIVWAKVQGYSYWPAKCLKVVRGKAHVRFFGKHEKSDLKINTIFHLSDGHPENKNKKITDRETSILTSLEYFFAREELLKYINLYEEKVGSFKFFNYRTLYGSENAESTTGKYNKCCLNRRNKVILQKKTNPMESASSAHSDAANSSEQVTAEVTTTDPMEELQLLETTPAVTSSNDVSINMSFSMDNNETENYFIAQDLPSTSKTLPVHRTQRKCIRSKNDVPNNQANATVTRKNTYSSESTQIFPHVEIAGSFPNISLNHTSKSNNSSNNISPPTEFIRIKDEFMNLLQTDELISVMKPSNTTQSENIQVINNMADSSTGSTVDRRNTHLPWSCSSTFTAAETEIFLTSLLLNNGTPSDETLPNSIEIKKELEDLLEIDPFNTVVEPSTTSLTQEPVNLISLDDNSRGELETPLDASKEKNSANKTAGHMPSDCPNKAVLLPLTNGEGIMNNFTGASNANDAEVIILEPPYENSIGRNINQSMILQKIMKRNRETCLLFQQGKLVLDSLVVHVWTEACKSLKDPEVISKAQTKIVEFQGIIKDLQTENDKLKEAEQKFQEETKNFKAEIKNLKLSLEAEKQKNLKLIKENEEIAKNANFVVDCLTHKFKGTQSKCMTSKTALLENVFSSSVQGLFTSSNNNS